MMQPTEVKLECKCCAKKFSLISWGEELESEPKEPAKCGRCSVKIKDVDQDNSATVVQR